jgi:hypothetical protein
MVMIWHTVRISFKDVPEEIRSDVEQRLADLPDVVPEIAWFRIGRDTVDPDISLIVSAFETLEKLDAYRIHPNHRPAQEALHGSGARILGMGDMETGDDPFGPLASKEKT